MKAAANNTNAADEEKRLKQDMANAKKEALLRLEAEKNQKLQDVRQELLAKLKGASTEQEKAAILADLQRKQQNIEQAMEAERAQQERELKKKLKALKEKRK